MRIGIKLRLDRGSTVFEDNALRFEDDGLRFEDIGLGVEDDGLRFEDIGLGYEDDELRFEDSGMGFEDAVLHLEDSRVCYEVSRPVPHFRYPERAERSIAIRTLRVRKVRHPAEMIERSPTDVPTDIV